MSVKVRPRAACGQGAPYLEEVPCPKCGNIIEVFSNENKIVCNTCTFTFEVDDLIKSEENRI